MMGVSGPAPRVRTNWPVPLQSPRRDTRRPSPSGRGFARHNANSGVWGQILILAPETFAQESRSDPIRDYTPPASLATFSPSRFPMRTLVIPSLAFVIAVASAACGPQAGSLEAANNALGAAQVNAIEFSGTGRWYQFGQAPAPNTA